MADAPDGLLTVRSPADGAVLAELRRSSTEEVHEAVALARSAQGAWAERSAVDRAACLARLGERLAEEADALVDAVRQETGRPTQEALVQELLPAVVRCHTMPSRLPALQAGARVLHRVARHRGGEARRVPYGVVAVLSPAPSPLGFGLAAAVDAAAAGNAVLLRPSSVAPTAALRACALAASCGIPEGVLQAVVTDRPAALELVGCVGVDRVLFAGAAETARAVRCAAAARGVPAVVQEGVPCTLVALEDCDVGLVARAIVQGAFAGSGQAGLAYQRVIAHDRVYDALVAEVVSLARGLRLGEDLGPMLRASRVERLERLVAMAREDGAWVITGGQRVEPEGLWFPPTVVAGCGAPMAVFREEACGPLVALARAPDDRALLDLVRAAPVGPSVAVFGEDEDAAEALAWALRAPVVLVNDLYPPTPEVALGPWARGSDGLLGGEEGLRAVTRPRYVGVSRWRWPVGAFWMPYAPGRERLARRALGALFGAHGLLGRTLDLL